jgi:hypothetical protein
MRWRKAGELAEQWIASVLGNPGLSIAVGTVVLFAIARIPTEIFYTQFGLRPEDVGLNSVQVLLQGTTTVLIIAFGMSVAFALLAALVPIRRWRGRLTLRISLALFPLLALLLAVLLLVPRALLDAASVKAGKGLHGPALVPWQAERVEVRWARGADESLPGCRWLFYLGEGGGKVALFDSKHDQTHRIDGGSVRLVFPEHCP